MVFTNLSKFIQFLLSANMSQVLLMFLATVGGLPVPLYPVQLLWTNMATDSLPALALGVDPAEKGIMDCGPRSRGQGIMTRESIVRIVARGSVLMVGTLSAYVGVLVLHGVPLSHQAFDPQYANSVALAQTAAFTALVFQKLLFSLTFRSLEHSIFSRATLGNPLLLGAIAVGALMQLVVVYLPGAETIFRTVPLGLAEWQIMAPAILVPVLVIDAFKVLRARRVASRGSWRGLPDGVTVCSGRPCFLDRWNRSLGTLRAAPFVRPDSVMRAAATLLIVQGYESQLREQVCPPLGRVIDSAITPREGGPTRAQAARNAYAVFIGLGLLLMAQWERAASLDLSDAIARLAVALSSDIVPTELPTEGAVHLDDMALFDTGDPVLDDVLQATLEQVGRSGLERATMQRIGRAAGVSEGFVFRRYPTKMDLFVPWTAVFGAAGIGPFRRHFMRVGPRMIPGSHLTSPD